MTDPENKREDLGSKLENIWDKVSKGVEEGLKVGKDEIIRTAKVGKIRLDIASLKSNKNEKIKLLGARVYGLLQSGEIKVPPLDDLLEEIKEVDAHIDSKEQEIQTVMEEKSVPQEEVTEEEIVVEAEVVAPSEEETAELEPAPKKRMRKKKDISTSKDEASEITEGQEEAAKDKIKE